MAVMGEGKLADIARDLGDSSGADAGRNLRRGLFDRGTTQTLSSPPLRGIPHANRMHVTVGYIRLRVWWHVAELLGGFGGEGVGCQSSSVGRG